jgi:hypothetical protein
MRGDVLGSWFKMMDVAAGWQEIHHLDPVSANLTGQVTENRMKRPDFHSLGG